MDPSAKNPAARDDFEITLRWGRLKRSEQIATIGLGVVLTGFVVLGVVVGSGKTGIDVWSLVIASVCVLAATGVAGIKMGRPVRWWVRGEALTRERRGVVQDQVDLAEVRFRWDRGAEGNHPRLTIEHAKGRWKVPVRRADSEAFERRVFEVRVSRGLDPSMARLGAKEEAIGEVVDILTRPGWRTAGGVFDHLGMVIAVGMLGLVGWIVLTGNWEPQWKWAGPVLAVLCAAAVLWLLYIMVIGSPRGVLGFLWRADADLEGVTVRRPPRFKPEVFPHATTSYKFSSAAMKLGTLRLKDEATPRRRVKLLVSEAGGAAFEARWFEARKRVEAERDLEAIVNAEVRVAGAQE